MSYRQFITKPPLAVNELDAAFGALDKGSAAQRPSTAGSTVNRESEAKALPPRAMTTQPTGSLSLPSLMGLLGGPLPQVAPAEQPPAKVHVHPPLPVNEVPLLSREVSKPPPVDPLSFKGLPPKPPAATDSQSTLASAPLRDDMRRVERELEEARARCVRLEEGREELLALHKREMNNLKVEHESEVSRLNTALRREEGAVLDLRRRHDQEVREAAQSRQQLMDVVNSEKDAIRREEQKR